MLNFDKSKSDLNKSKSNCEWLKVRVEGRTLFEIDPENPQRIRIMNKWYGEKKFYIINVMEYAKKQKDVSNHE